MRIEPTVAEIRPVRRLQFGVLSPEDIKTMSVVTIKYPETWVSGGKPKEGGVLDAKLGTMDFHMKCETCKGNWKQCPGHFGHIELAKPVFHVGFLPVIVKVLTCVCINCSKLLVPHTHKDIIRASRLKSSRARLNVVFNACRSRRTCGGRKEEDVKEEETTEDIGKSGCGCVSPNYRRDGLLVNLSYGAAANVADLQADRHMSAERALQVLRGISEEDIHLLGFDGTFCRPEWLLMTTLAVPPPHVRPSVMGDDTMRSEDDLTHQLQNIVKANNAVLKGERSGHPSSVMEEYTYVLQYHVAAFMKNDALDSATGATVKQRSGRPIKAIATRLKGKYGRVRGNLMGKRVDFSARSVITGDPNLSIDQVGVPKTIALTMTTPEVVTAINRKAMELLVRNGPDDHPGAKYVTAPGGERFDLRFNRDVTLTEGCIVDRHIQDGDAIVFNRQPSLHKMSIMGHKVKIMPYSTFRLNLSCTSPYNADFDGDEMNLHVPQSLEAKAEVEQIMMVQRQIVSPQANRPVIGIVQDSLLGSRQFTTRDTFMNSKFLMNLMMWLTNFNGHLPMPAILKPVPLWTGKQVFSMFLPDVNLRRFAAWHPSVDPVDFSETDTQVSIVSGELLTGTLCKRSLGTSEGSLVHVIWQEHGPEAAKAFLNQTQGVVNYWLLHQGFTIGVEDTIADEDTVETIAKTLEEAKLAVSNLRAQAQSGQMKTKMGRTLQESFETDVNDLLKEALGKTGLSAKESLKSFNAIYQMVTAGSKGSETNISQIIACVGQQNVNGRRIPFGFRQRTLPHFTKDDYGPESRGFVANSYLKGLTPQEFFFHAMGGREGLIDTAVKTSETGYIQRRLVKAMEDVMVKYDGTVRDSRGNIMQFLYGEDGVDATAIEKQKLASLQMKDAAFTNTYDLQVYSSRFGQGYIDPINIEEVRANKESMALLEGELERLKADRQLMRTVGRTTADRPGTDDAWPLPLNIARLIDNAKKMGRVHRFTISDMSPVYVVVKVAELLQRLVVVPGVDLISQQAQENATELFCMHLRGALASKRVLREYCLSKKSFDWLLAEIETRFRHAKVQPGEMVGALAAQSIGEPATQMTLNTFHLAGVGSKNVTSGVPRLKEIINVATNVKTPSLTVFLRGIGRTDQAEAEKMMLRLEFTTLRSITESTEIYFDPVPEDTVVKEDRGWVRDHYRSSDIQTHALSPWMLRIILDPKLVAGRLIDIRFVKKCIEERLKDLVSDAGGIVPVVISTPPNAEKKVIHVRLQGADKVVDEILGGGDGKKEQDNEITFDFIKAVERSVLSDVKVEGIEGIKKVYLRKDKVNVVNATTGAFETEDEWVLDTEGSNMLSVMCHPLVDHTRTVSNDIREMLSVLGIEAARNSVFKEMRTVIQYDNSYVNYRHIALLSDIMTYRGYLMPITRHGMNRRDNSTLMKCSFEETVDILFDAAVFSDCDAMNGVSDNIVLGQLAPLGTGEFDVFMDEDMLDSERGFGGTGAVDMFTEDVGADTAGPVHTPYNLGPTPNWLMQSPGSMSPGQEIMFSPDPHAQDMYGGRNDKAAYQNASIGQGQYRVTSPAYGSDNYSPTSPRYVQQESPRYTSSSQAYGNGGVYSPSSPAYGAASPAYSPSSPAYGAASPAYSPSSPAYGAASPAYSPSSPAYGAASPAYSPSSPAYGAASPAYSPSSPAYGAASPAYSPSSPAYGAASPAYSPSSPAYGAASPAYSPSSPAYGAASPAYSPSSPAYGAASPGYSPASPAYSPSSPAYGVSSPAYGTTTGYSPKSPAYSPNDNAESSGR